MAMPVNFQVSIPFREALECSRTAFFANQERKQREVARAMGIKPKTGGQGRAAGPHAAVGILANRGQITKSEIGN